ncbi:FAD-dependent oxidoreductase [Massilia arenosa]|uniref:FAD-dependent oxidoreductase n=1 Tax=Zemynaea arenosa TaxID=2561931 RepID=A0A4Y9SA73_9BURK|nr:FAD-dependent oxidoreductase [Massilia arenosa]TFW16628.1 FAD-dependent oxidoreductase [Massilia arenosa]
MYSTGSIWKATADIPDYPALAARTRADVCVVGAGIAGLTTAYLLLRAGKKVLVLDADTIGSGETGRTTAHFFPPDERYYQLQTKFGEEQARMVANSFRQATDLVENIIREEQIDCSFLRLDGYLIPQVHGQNDAVEKEYVAAHRLGVDVERLERVPGMVYDTGPCVRFRNNAQFHPLRYLAGLAKAIEKLGGVIHCHTRALGIDKEGAEQKVRTTGGDVHAQHVVVATHTPFNDQVVMHTKQAGYSTYVVGFKVKKGAIPQMLLWDTGDPYYYVRLATFDDSDEDILIVGGQDHKTGQETHSQHRWDEIEMWTRNRFVHVGEIAYRWSGEVMEPSDGVAYLGRNPMDSENVYLITGDSGNGMTSCTVGAMIVRDLITGASNTWTSLYAPNRKPFHGLGDFLTEQTNVAQQYGDWLNATAVTSPEHIAPGEGALIRRGLQLYAVYRPEEGDLQVLSAKCTHLGCAVHWNSPEKSWDCPCHGSRFRTSGEVLHGPAVAPLAIVTLPRE